MTCNFGRFSEKGAPREQWIGNNFINKKLFVEKKKSLIENTDLVEKTVVYEVNFLSRTYVNATKSRWERYKNDPVLYTIIFNFAE